MDTREKDIEKLKDYKYGFTTDIESIKAPKGLNEDVIKFISNIMFKKLNYFNGKYKSNLFFNSWR